MRALGLSHRATYILVFNSHGKLFVQERTMTKDIFPGFYDVVSGGVVQDGETYDESALRELEEEMGIKDVPLTYLFEFPYEDDNFKLWGRAYKCVYDGEIVLQEEEVKSGAFYRIPEILEMTKEKSFTPDGNFVLQNYLAEYASHESI
jgi:8-oxo-dGTP pyrophosphatase MutT (NUDIX family)